MTARTFVLPIAALVVALGLAACGDAKDGKSESEKATAATDRRNFEAGVVSNTGRYGMSPAQVSCTQERLRATVSDEQLDKQLVDGKPNMPLRRAVLGAMGTCTSGNDSPLAFIRDVTEAAHRKQARRSGIPKKTLDCILRTLRSSGIYEEILAATTPTTQLAVTSKSARTTQSAVRSCS